MRLVTYVDGEASGVGAELDAGRLLLLDRFAAALGRDARPYATMRAFLSTGAEGLEAAAALIGAGREGGSGDAVVAASSVRLLAPVPEPTLIVAAGMAYRSHNAEMRQSQPKEPHGFLKAPVCISAPGGAVALPQQAPSMVDFEGELCAVIGRRCHNADVAEADACIVGYTVANDLSARDWVGRIGAATTPAEVRTAWDLNHMGKQLPAFLPLGPALVTRDDCPAPAEMRLRTRLNGRIMQEVMIEDLLFSPAEMLAYFSRWYVFRPGDLLLTGTPAGVGYGRTPKVFIVAGDRVDVEVTGLGTLSSTFVES